MSDLISRQAAIDALKDATFDWEACEVVLKQLPPAELGTNLAEVGTDAISRQAAIDAMAELQGSTSSKGVLKGISKAWKRIEQLPPIQPEPHWIPVTEDCECDLMDNEEVLVFQKDGTISGQIRHAMFYDFNGKKKFVTWEGGITIYHVVAYMPLPEPYKGVTE